MLLHHRQEGEGRGGCLTEARLSNDCASLRLVWIKRFKILETPKLQNPTRETCVVCVKLLSVESDP